MLRFRVGGRRVLRLAGGPRRDLDCRYGLDHLGRPQSAPTVKQHLAAIRMMFDWLATRGMLPFNPVTAGPAKHVVKRGKHRRGHARGPARPGAGRAHGTLLRLRCPQ